MELGDFIFLGLTLGFLISIVGLVYLVVSLVRALPETEGDIESEKELLNFLSKFIPASILAELYPHIKNAKAPLLILMIGLFIIFASFLLELF
jgi:hypothetical protein